MRPIAGVGGIRHAATVAMLDYDAAQMAARPLGENLNSKHAKIVDGQ